MDASHSAEADPATTVATLDGPPRATGLHCWLPAVVPVDALRMRVADPELAATLRDAGADLVSGPAEVEIGPIAWLQRDAPVAIVSIGGSQLGGTRLASRAIRRFRTSAHTRVESRRVQRELSRLGYDAVTALTWDIDLTFQLPWTDTHRHAIRDLLPERAIVVATRGPAAPTALDAALASACAESGATLGRPVALARPGMVVVLCDTHVARVTIGPSSAKIDRQGTVLRALTAPDVDPVVRHRLPRRVADGRAGLACWSLETRLGGRPPRSGLTPALEADCLEFLVTLFDAAGPADTGWSVSERARLAAAACAGPDDRAFVLSLGRAVDRELARLPRGVAHGDFWVDNLLVREERLSGVVDWDGAGDGRLPFLDLLHLVLSAERARTNRLFGPTVVDFLMPWASAGGSPLVRAYAARTGIALDDALLRALTVALWIDHLALELSAIAERSEQVTWVEQNVSGVIEALRAPGWTLPES